MNDSVLGFPVSGEALIRLIPQKPPFVFISSLDSVSENTCTTTFIFDKDHALCDDGTLSAAGVLEHIAQSAGCKSGYENFVSGKKGSLGFIGEIRDFVCSRLPHAGETLTTFINREAIVYGVVSIIIGKVSIGEEEIASCRIKVFFVPDTEVSTIVHHP